MAEKPRDTLTSWPHLLLRELAVFAWVTAAFVVLSILVDAPLRAPADPDVPENPAKAPWYFLGLQELVSYSAFAGGLFLPFFALFGLALIPFLDREQEGTGQWLGARVDKRVTLLSLAFGLVVTIGMLAFTVRYGWLRLWVPTIPQWVITILNPGTVLTGAYVAWSVTIYKVTGSTRQSAVAIFTLFLVGFVVLTVMGTMLRGPNWEFYWRPADWPAP